MIAWIITVLVSLGILGIIGLFSFWRFFHVDCVHELNITLHNEVVRAYKNNEIRYENTIKGQKEAIAELRVKTRVKMKDLKIWRAEVVEKYKLLAQHKDSTINMLQGEMDRMREAAKDS